MTRIHRTIAFIALVLFAMAPFTPAGDPTSLASTKPFGPVGLSSPSSVPVSPTPSASPSSSTQSSPASTVSTQTDPVAERLYYQSWKYVKDNFLWQERLKDWDSWEHRYDGKLKNPTEAEKAIKEMLSSLKDGYTCFKDAQQTADHDKKSDERDVVEARLLPGNVGYIRIRTFGSKHVAGEVEDSLRLLRNAKSFVIDLRDNGGGYIWQAFEVFSLLADTGTFTTLKGMQDGAAYTEDLVLTATGLDDIENGHKVTSSRRDNLAGKAQLVILVNSGTASASEMLAGALRDNGRAIIVGSLTYGKGIAQLTTDMALKTSVRVTFAQYFLPKGECIHGKGIKPHVIVPASTRGDAQLDAAKKELEPKAQEK